MRKDSPEDRLLHLIKGKRNKEKEVEGEPQEAPVAEKSILTKATKQIFLKNKLISPTLLTPINKILITVLVIAAIYFAHTFFSAPYYRDMGVLLAGGAALAPGVIPGGKAKAAGEIDYSTYSRDIRGKELFSAPFVKDTKDTGEPEIDVSKRFSLVGIIAGDRPQAIIEDTETKKTHYLYEGQSINGIKILKVDERKVVLAYEGREITLAL